MKKSEIIAEVLTRIKKYDDLGLVDETTLELELANKLKKFGGNTMELGATVLEIKGGKVNLPPTFFKLKKAIKVDPYKVECENQVDDLWLTDYSVKRVLETDWEWDNGSNSHYKKAYKDIVHLRRIKGNDVNFHYVPMEVVALTKGLSKDFISHDCLNKQVSVCKGFPEINIVGKTLYSNFKEGELYIEYERLPEEDGELVVPDITNLIDYLINHLCYIALSGVWVNSDVDAVQQKMMFFKNEANLLWNSAMTAVKFERLPSNWNIKFQQRQRKNINKYNR